MVSEASSLTVKAKTTGDTADIIQGTWREAFPRKRGMNAGDVAKFIDSGFLTGYLKSTTGTACISWFSRSKWANPTIEILQCRKLSSQVSAFASEWHINMVLSTQALRSFEWLRIVEHVAHHASAGGHSNRYKASNTRAQDRTDIAS